ncbi:ABC transporter permease [Erythrobacter sp. CCH5-A1]|jgi:cell division transport system permease protein|uniref:cell division protein FtsX n=1 Tax=Erythrobacter sp. CCH5-A1 TaxID=1768792 RepID=UPI0009EC248D|nr:FtsX-like permease family protein [Erythrobacter sp. CCH5-A1]
MSSLPPLPAEAEEGEALPERPKGRAAARLLPPQRLTGPIPWVIAILIALVVIAAAGGLALRNLSAAASASLSRAVSVQVIEPNPDLREARKAAAVKVLTGLPGVTAVQALPEAELVAMLEPWLGAGASSGDVPIPALIDVELAASAGPDEVARIAAAVKQQVPGARVDAQGDFLRPVNDALAALQWLALGLVALVALATAAAVWLAARNAFAGARDTVEIMHLLGASQRQITAVFLRDVLREAIFGALLGTGLGVAAVWLLGQQFAQLGSGMVSGGGLMLADWLIIGAVPLAGVLLAGLTARITIALALKDML